MKQEQIQDLFEYRDGKLYWKNHKYKGLNGKRAGTPHKKGYWNIQYEKKLYLEHRLIYIMHYGDIKEQIDHINGIKNDNRIENLRQATNSQNQANTNSRINSKSGIRNVHWVARDKKWTVQMYIDGVKRSFGNYYGIECAKFVADFIRHKHHKEFANHG